jgi:hypothetical protein
MCENYRPSFVSYNNLSLDVTVDLRDTVGDRLYLSKGFNRDGVSVWLISCTLFLKLVQTLFDIGQATTLK